MNQFRFQIIFIILVSGHISSQATITAGSCGANFSPVCVVGECVPCTPCNAPAQRLCPRTCNHLSCDDLIYGKTNFAGRSQGRDTSRWLVGNHENWFHYADAKTYATFAVILEYTHSFKPHDLGVFLSPVCSNCFTIGPDQHDPVGQDTNVRGQDFGLGTTHTATVVLNPRIENFIADIRLDLDLNCFACGTFAYLDIPITHTWWNPDICAFDCQPGDPDFPACLMSGQMDSQGQLVTEEVGVDFALGALRGDFIWGDVSNPFCFGVLGGCGQQVKTGIAEIRAGLGYNILLNDCYALGVKVVVAAPSGTLPHAQFIFEPIVGNGCHWEAGGGLIGFASLWCRNDQSLTFYFDSEFTHLFKSRTHTRLFDLTQNGPYSRYLLLKRFDADGMYDGLERGPNVFAQKVKSRINIQADATALITYQNCGYMLDLGYNFWGRSQERLFVTCCILNDTFGIKGTLPVCDHHDGNDKDIRTASLSTIAQSKGIDGADDGPNPIFIQCGDLDVCSATNPSAWSHAFVAHFGYAWPDCVCGYMPYFGAGGKIEWSGKGNRALNQWSIWAKGSVSF